MIPTSHHGAWRGRNRLYLEPGSPADVSEAELQVTADGVTVRWAYQGKPQVGTLALRGPPSSCAADFVDTFHAAGGLKFHGFVQGARLSLYGTYPAGPGLPDWGWRIELDWGDPDALGLRMLNVLPTGEESIAVALPASR